MRPVSERKRGYEGGGNKNLETRIGVSRPPPYETGPTA